MDPPKVNEPKGGLTDQAQVHTETASGDELFAFELISRPAVTDAGGSGKWTLVNGPLDRNSADTERAHDGAFQTAMTIPSQNVSLFAAGTSGGSVLLDLERKVRWRRLSATHGTRADVLHRSTQCTGRRREEPGFSPPTMDSPKLHESVWKRIALIDTRNVSESGGQARSENLLEADSLGEYRYLVSKCRIQKLVTRSATHSSVRLMCSLLMYLLPSASQSPKKRVILFTSKDGKYEFTVDVTNALELEQWSINELQPVIILEWYPGFVSMLPSEGFEARRMCVCGICRMPR